jgi:hypothetical protein
MNFMNETSQLFDKAVVHFKWKGLYYETFKMIYYPEWILSINVGMIESIVMWFVAYSAYIMPETEKKKTQHRQEPN